MEGYEDRAHKQIKIESWSNSARTLNLRGSTPGGPFAESHTTNADRSRATDTYEIHGIPSKLQVSPSAAPVRRGECYVRVTLLLDGEPVQRLSAGYLTDSKTLSWPPGILEDFTSGKGLPVTVTGTNRAAGTEVVETVPTNARWVIKGFTAALVADANAASRRPVLIIDDGSTVLTAIPSETTLTATNGNVYAWISGLGFAPADVAGLSVGSLDPLPEDLIVFQGWRIRTSTVSLQAGDDWGAPVIVAEELIEE